jgi:hypothetical protein
MVEIGVDTFRMTTDIRTRDPINLSHIMTTDICMQIHTFSTMDGLKVLGILIHLITPIRAPTISALRSQNLLSTAGQMEFPSPTPNETEITAPHLLHAMGDLCLASEAHLNITTMNDTCHLVHQPVVALALALSNHLDSMSAIRSAPQVGLFLDLHMSKIFDLKWVIDILPVVLHLVTDLVAILSRWSKVKKTIRPHS